MYNPPRYQYSNPEEIFELIDRNPFATVISVNDGKPFVSHLPLTPQKFGDGEIEIIGHMARANPHWKFIQNSPAKVIFHGADAYITPRWYEKDDVPTWNYVTLHADATVSLIEDEAGVLACLRKLTEHVERHWPSGWDFYVPEDLAGEKLTRGIVGLKFTILKFDYKKKLTQNKSAGSRAGVLRGLEARQDEGSQKVLAEMRKLFKADGELI